MKRKIRYKKDNCTKLDFALLLVFCVVLLSGCGIFTVSSDIEIGNINSGDNTTINDTIHSQNTELSSENNVSFQHGSVQTSAILEKKQAADEDGVLWYIPNQAVESGIQQTIHFYGDKLLLSGTELVSEGAAKTAIQLLDLQTGEVLKKAEFHDLELLSVQVCGEVIAVMDWADGKIFLLDDQLQITEQYKIAVSYCTFYLSPDAKYAYVFTQNDGICVVELTSGKEKILLDNAKSLFVSNNCGTAITFAYTDVATQSECYGMVDMTTNEIVHLPFEGSFSNISYTDGIWAASTYDEEPTYCIGKTDCPNVFQLNENTINLMLLPDTKQLMTFAYEEAYSGMALYSLNGNFLSHTKLGIAGALVMETPIWSQADGGYFLLALDQTGKDMLLFWDTTIPQSGMNLQFEAFKKDTIPEGTIVSQKLYNRAAEIGQQYGIDIFIAEQTDLDYGDYQAKQEFYEIHIETALEEIAQVLSAYPSGFFQQLCYGDIRKIELHLAGHLEKVDIPQEEINGFTSFTGFTQQQAGKALVVLDITWSGSMEQTLHHEFFHLIDGKLSFDAKIRKEAKYSEENWMCLNPAGFAYAEDTSVLPEEIFASDYDEWFVNLYSRTFSKEDRATIMEYASSGEEWMFVSAPYRQAKLEYLCNCIRDAFDTTGWPEQTVWEDTLIRSRMGF